MIEEMFWAVVIGLLIAAVFLMSAPLVFGALVLASARACLFAIDLVLEC